MPVGYCYDFICYSHRVLVVNNVCCWITIFVLSNSPFINNVHPPSRVALLYSIGYF